MDEISKLFQDPLFWIALLSAFSAFGFYIINKKIFNLFYGKPIIKIMEISIKPAKNKFEHESEYYYIKIQILNPSSFGNHVSGTLKKFFFSPPLTTKMYQLNKQAQEGDFCELPGFKKIFVEIYPGYEKIKEYENKKLLLTIKDIRGKKIKKRFKCEDTENN